VRALVAAIECLAFYPTLGRLSQVAGTRALAAQEHRIVYQLSGDGGAAEDVGDVLVLDMFGPGEM